MADETGADAANYANRMAVETQLKFFYFMVGLTFAILGLSVETSDNATWLTQCSWLSLLLSGLIGISRLSWHPIALNMNSAELAVKFYKSSFERMKLEGTPTAVDQSTGEEHDIDELIKGRVAFLKNIRMRLDDLDMRQDWRSKIQMWGFSFGILGLAGDKILLSVG